ncbi:MAG: hypothetical protein JO115_06085 [Pseudonocardiales bacterium]|nr:hypothetical protein [Pseudonocardiales bacterium]
MIYITTSGVLRPAAAGRKCLDAIVFALEDDPSEYDSDTQAIAFEVSVAPAT